MPAKHQRQRDIVLAFMNLSGIRKFEQVVISVLSATKGKEAQGTIAVSLPIFLCYKSNGVMVRDEKSGQNSKDPKMTHYPPLG